MKTKITNITTKNRVMLPLHVKDKIQQKNTFLFGK